VHPHPPGYMDRPPTPGAGFFQGPARNTGQKKSLATRPVSVYSRSPLADAGAPTGHRRNARSFWVEPAPERTTRDATLSNAPIAAAYVSRRGLSRKGCSSWAGPTDAMCGSTIAGSPAMPSSYKTLVRAVFELGDETVRQCSAPWERKMTKASARLEGRCFTVTHYGLYAVAVPIRLSGISKRLPCLFSSVPGARAWPAE